MVHSIRSTFSYTLYFVALAVLAFWLSYQTVNPTTAATLTSASIESQGAQTAEGLGSAQSWVSSHAHPLVATANAVRTGLGAH